MELYLDSASLKDINESVQTGIISGITVNQSLLAKEPKRDPIEHFTDIIKELHESDYDVHLSLPLYGTTVDEMLAVSEQMNGLFALNTDISLKVPMSWANLPLISLLVGQGHTVNATCVFSVYQADLAVRAGAHIVSLFVGRMNDVSPDYGYRVLDTVRKRYKGEEGIKVIAGSVRNEAMVARCEECGADIVTTSRAVLESMATDQHSEESTRRFNMDFEAWQSKADEPEYLWSSPVKVIEHG